MWYHLRREYLGKNPTIIPRVPDAVSDNVICRVEEGDIPRICVSDNVFRCILGIIGMGEPSVGDIARRFDENPCLYITDSVPYVPPNCLDFRYTNEHWFITPTKFVYLGRVNMNKLYRRNVIELTSETEIKPYKGDKIFHLEDVKSNVLNQLIKGGIT